MNKPAKPKVQAQSLKIHPDQPRNFAIQAAVVFTLAFALYANTITHDYAVDDTIVVKSNTLTAKGLKGIPMLMQTDAFYGFFGKEQLVEGGRYRPLSIVTLAIENQLFGKVIKDANGKPILDKDGDKNYKGNPHISHFINIVLFGLTGVLIFYLLATLLNTSISSPIEWNIPLLAAALFMAHPIHTEAVANIKGRDEVMGMLGALLTLYFAVLYVKRQNVKYLGFTLAAWVFALLSKENAITYLAIVPLTFYFFTKATVKQYAAVMLVMLWIAGIYLVLRGKFTGSDLIQGQSSPEILNNPFVFATKSERFATISYTFGEYLRLLFFPHPLTHDYYYNQVPIINWASWKALVPLFVNLGIIAFGIWGLFRKNIFAYAILYYYITMSVVSNIPLTVGIAMNERFVYLSSLAFCLAIALLLVMVTNYIREKKFDYKKALNPVPLSAAMLLILAGYSYKTIMRNFDWKDDFTLFKADAKNSPNSCKIHNALGGEYLTQAKSPGLDPQVKKEYEIEAERVLKRAIEIYPKGKYMNALLLMGNAKYALYPEKPDTALYYYRKSLEIKPMYFDGNFNMGCVLMETARSEEAIPYFKRAIRSKPDKFEAYVNLSEAYYRVAESAGDSTMKVAYADTVIATFRNVIAKTSDRGRLANSYFKIGKAYRIKGDKNNATVNFKKATELDPANPEYLAEAQPPDTAIDSFRKNLAAATDPAEQAKLYYNIGKTFGQRKNQLDSAIVYLTKAIELDSTNVVYYEDLGVAYGFKEDFPKSIAVLQNALKINPNYSKIYLNLSISYRSLGQIQEANMYLAKAQELQKIGK